MLAVVEPHAVIVGHRRAVHEAALVVGLRARHLDGHARGAAGRLGELDARESERVAGVRIPGGQRPGGAGAAAGGATSGLGTTQRPASAGLDVTASLVFVVAIADDAADALGSSAVR